MSLPKPLAPTDEGYLSIHTLDHLYTSIMFLT